MARMGVYMLIPTLTEGTLPALTLNGKMRSAKSMFCKIFISLLVGSAVINVSHRN